MLQACADNSANEIDGRFSDALRNTLFGEFGEDLASRNLFRGREVGIEGYSGLARCFGFEPRPSVRCHCLCLLCCVDQQIWSPVAPPVLYTTAWHTAALPPCPHCCVTALPTLLRCRLAHRCAARRCAPRLLSVREPPRRCPKEQQSRSIGCPSWLPQTTRAGAR